MVFYSSLCPSNPIHCSNATMVFMPFPVSQSDHNSIRVDDARFGSFKRLIMIRKCVCKVCLWCDLLLFWRCWPIFVGVLLRIALAPSITISLTLIANRGCKLTKSHSSKHRRIHTQWCQKTIPNCHHHHCLLRRHYRRYPLHQCMHVMQLILMCRNH